MRVQQTAQPLRRGIRQTESGLPPPVPRRRLPLPLTVSVIYIVTIPFAAHMALSSAARGLILTWRQPAFLVVLASAVLFAAQSRERAATQRETLLGWKPYLLPAVYALGGLLLPNRSWEVLVLYAAWGFYWAVVARSAHGLSNDQARRLGLLISLASLASILVMFGLGLSSGLQNQTIGGNRLSAGLENPNIFSQLLQVLLLGLVVSVHWGAFGSKRRRRIALAIALLVCLVLGYMAGASNLFVAVLAGGFVYYWRAGRKGGLFRPVLTLLLVGLLIAFGYALQDRSLEESSSGRMSLWESSWEMTTESSQDPIAASLVIGFDDPETGDIKSYGTATADRDARLILVDNTYLGFLLEGGLVLLVAWLLPFYSLWRWSRRRVAVGRQERRSHDVLVALLFAGAAEAVVVSLGPSFANSLSMAFVLAICAVVMPKAESESPRDR